MGRFEMNGVDRRRLQLVHQILSQVVDRLIELEDIELEVEFEPLTKIVEIDRIALPHFQ